MNGKPREKSLFRFKQFELSNERSAMKVGTDGVMLGAWADVAGASVVWDVGAGTGLIALMVAQRCNADVIGIELDAVASQEAAENVGRSPWSDRVRIINEDITLCYNRLPAPDLIVSNPPYFVDSLRPCDAARSSARHEAGLSYGRLIEIAAERLSADGRLCMISPFDRGDDIEWACCLNKLFVAHVTDVCTVAGKPASRRLWTIGRKSVAMRRDVMCIRDNGNSFSETYRKLTSDFYLDF